MYIIFTVAVFSAVLLLLLHIYRTHWSSNLSVTLRFDSDGVYEGERCRMIETISNRKLLPILWGSIQFSTSSRLHYDGESSDHDYYKKDNLSVFSYEEVTKRLAFTAERRGFYHVDEAELVTGDLLFSTKFIKNYPVSTGLFVYPRIKDTSRFSLDFNKVVGDVISRRSLVEDPFEFRGIRDYTPLDQMKSVNWRATARTGSLKVNVYNRTTSQEVLLLLDLDGYNKFDGQEIKEDVIRIGAHLAAKLLARGVPVGLATNAASSVTKGSIHLECRNGRSHHVHILRELASIDTDNLLCPFGDILTALPKSGPQKQCVLISYFTGAELARQIAEAEAEGIGMQWIALHNVSRKTDFVKRKNMTVCEVDY